MLNLGSRFPSDSRVSNFWLECHIKQRRGPGIYHHRRSIRHTAWSHLGPAESGQKALYYEGDRDYRVKYACGVILSVWLFAHWHTGAKSDYLVSFSRIYFASDAVGSAVPALLTNGASSELKERIYEKFSIRSTVDRSFWNKERSSIQISRGPCKHFHIAVPVVYFTDSY